MRLWLGLVLPVLMLGGCSSGTGSVRGEDGIGHRVDVSHIPDARPRVEPRSKYGNPDSYVVNGRRYHVRKSAAGYVERGIASWYGRKFHGRRTSSGEPYNMYAMTAAHKTLPLPTYVRVTNLKNGRSVVVKVNDRGPFHDNRLIDLSYAAAEKLGIVGTGTGFVEVRAIDPRHPQRVTSSRPRPSASAPDPGPEPAPATTANGGRPAIYIQVGAFSERANAERLRQRLPHTLGSVYIRKGWSNQRPVWRVQVGPIATVEQA
ncbi:MAG: septal ring lytic transglycosylase RlpA family protein, partial [Gammaproteobacteria bacterium]